MSRTHRPSSSLMSIWSLRLLAILASYNLALTLRHVYDRAVVYRGGENGFSFSQWVRGNRAREHVYSYIGNDYPPHFTPPTGPLDRVGMAMHDSARYPFHIVHPFRNKSAGAGEEEYDIADVSWETLTTNPAGFGWVVLPYTPPSSSSPLTNTITNTTTTTTSSPFSTGPARFFMLTIFHQLHCVRQLQRAFSTPGPLPRAHPIANEHHVRHCLGYLRDSVLCGAGGGGVVERGDVFREFVEGGGGVYGLWDDDEETSSTSSPDSTSTNQTQRKSKRKPITIQTRIDTAECLDWTTIYVFAERNWFEWIDHVMRDEELFGLVPWDGSAGTGETKEKSNDEQQEGGGVEGDVEGNDRGVHGRGD